MFKRRHNLLLYVPATRRTTYLPSLWNLRISVPAGPTRKFIDQKEAHCSALQLSFCAEPKWIGESCRKMLPLRNSAFMATFEWPTNVDRGERKRGRPRQRWEDEIEEEIARRGPEMDKQTVISKQTFFIMILWFALIQWLSPWDRCDLHW